MAAMHGRFTGSQILIQNGKINDKKIRLSTESFLLHNRYCTVSEIVKVYSDMKYYIQLKLFITNESCFFALYTGGEIDSSDVYGNTPLHVAARYGQELLISTLLSHGADKTR